MILIPIQTISVGLKGKYSRGLALDLFSACGGPGIE
jgi:hypothetical protein